MYVRGDCQTKLSYIQSTGILLSPSRPFHQLTIGKCGHLGSVPGCIAEEICSPLQNGLSHPPRYSVVCSLSESLCNSHWFVLRCAGCV